MKKLLRLVILATVLLAAWPAQAQGSGQTLVVSPAGAYTTIEAAMAEAQEGIRLRSMEGFMLGH